MDTQEFINASTELQDCNCLGHSRPVLIGCERCGQWLETEGIFLKFDADIDSKCGAYVIYTEAHECIP